MILKDFLIKSAIALFLASSVFIWAHAIICFRSHKSKTNCALIGYVGKGVVPIVDGVQQSIPFKAKYLCDNGQILLEQ